VPRPTDPDLTTRRITALASVDALATFLNRLGYQTDRRATFPAIHDHFPPFKQALIDRQGQGRFSAAGFGGGSSGGRRDEAHHSVRTP
jgi:hypothetical protein